jgi:hypothetical protein
MNQIRRLARAPAAGAGGARRGRPGRGPGLSLSLRRRGTDQAGCRGGRGSGTVARARVSGCGSCAAGVALAGLWPPGAGWRPGAGPDCEEFCQSHWHVESDSESESFMILLRVILLNDPESRAARRPAAAVSLASGYYAGTGPASPGPGLTAAPPAGSISVLRQLEGAS